METQMETQILSKDNLLKYIKEVDYVSCIEIKRRFDCNGGMAITLPMNKNIILFYGLSETASKMITELINEKKIYLHPTNVLTYLIDGGVMNIPIANSKNFKKYKTDHWFPCVLRSQEHFEQSLRDANIKIKRGG